MRKLAPPDHVHEPFNLFIITPILVDTFLDVNQNKSIESYEQMEPLHLNYEANSSESEQMISNRTETNDPRIEQYLREQFETSLEITANSESVEQTDDATPIRMRKDKNMAIRKKVKTVNTVGSWFPDSVNRCYLHFDTNYLLCFT